MGHTCRQKRWTSVCLSVWLGWAIAAARPALAVPPGFNVQGRLTDSTGVNRDGAFSMRFTIFDAATGGSDLWAKTFAAVPIRNGSFQVTLGDPADTAGQTLPNVFTGDSRFLEIQVLSGPGIPASEAPLVPRQQLVSVPYAFRSETVRNAAMLTSTGSIVLSAASGRIGVGVSSPAYNLDVAGDINFTGTLRQDGVPVLAGGVSFGGLFYTAGAVCVSANPATGACSCPSGFSDSSYYVYQAGGINCGWTAGYTALVPCYGRSIDIHQCWRQVP